MRLPKLQAPEALINFSDTDSYNFLFNMYVCKHTKTLLCEAMCFKQEPLEQENK